MIQSQTTQTVKTDSNYSKTQGVIKTNQVCKYTTACISVIKSDKFLLAFWALKLSLSLSLCFN